MLPGKEEKQARPVPAPRSFPSRYGGSHSQLQHDQLGQSRRTTIGNNFLSKDTSPVETLHRVDADTSTTLQRHQAVSDSFELFHSQSSGDLNSDNEPGEIEDYSDSSDNSISFHTVSLSDGMPRRSRNIAGAQKQPHLAAKHQRGTLFDKPHPALQTEANREHPEPRSEGIIHFGKAGSDIDRRVNYNMDRQQSFTKPHVVGSTEKACGRAPLEGSKRSAKQQTSSINDVLNSGDSGDHYKQASYTKPHVVASAKRGCISVQPNRVGSDPRSAAHAKDHPLQSPSLTRPHKVSSTYPNSGCLQSGDSEDCDAPSHMVQVQRATLQVKRPTVFITYAEEEEKRSQHLVRQLAFTLLQKGIIPRVDMLESTVMSMGISSWLDTNVKKCDFVIACVSPSYRSQVEPYISPDTTIHSLHTRYIYNQLMTEYIDNASQNFRFIPILVGGATRNDLPSLYHDTMVYEWPKQNEEMIYRLYRKEMYVRPKLGPVPQCIVEPY